MRSHQRRMLVVFSRSPRLPLPSRGGGTAPSLSQLKVPRWGGALLPLWLHLAAHCICRFAWRAVVHPRL